MHPFRIFLKQKHEKIEERLLQEGQLQKMNRVDILLEQIKENQEIMPLDLTIN